MHGSKPFKLTSLSLTRTGFHRWDAHEQESLNYGLPCEGKHGDVE